MGQKLFTLSFDDGTEQDCRLIALMEKYGVKGTFNISSGIFGRKSYIKRVGNGGKAPLRKTFFTPSFTSTTLFSPKRTRSVSTQARTSRSRATERIILFSRI